MADYQEPSKNPSDAEGGFAGMLRIAFNKLMQNTHGQLPAIVESYDDITNTATVRPSIMVVGTEGEIVGRAPLARISVLMLAGGNYALRFPVRAGDAGWIEASDRDISLFLQAGAQKSARPNTPRMHSFSDGRFIPDAFQRAVVAEENKERVTLQSMDGSVYIAIGDDGVHITGPMLTVDAPALFKQPVTMQAAATMQAGATIGGITFSEHKHGGIQRGDQASDGPQ